MAKKHRLDFSFDPRNLVKFLVAVTVQTFKTFAALFRAIFRQLGQMRSGLWRYATEEAELETFIPEWFLRITVYAIPNAIAGETPGKQIEGSIILMGWGIFTSAFTGGATIVFVWFWSLFFWMGVFRYSDWGSSLWQKTTSASASLPGRGSNGSYRTRGRK